MSDDARKKLLLAGAAAGVACGVGALLDAPAFFHSYLIAFLLWSGLPLGALVLVCIQHVAAGEWGFVSRRVLEAASRTLYWLPLFFLPVLFGASTIYPWMGETAAENELVTHKSPYLNPGFFLVRTALYFVVWAALAQQLNRYSAEQDRGDRLWVSRLQATGAAGILLYGLTMTFASIDWGMSLEPMWFSTIYGLLFMVGQVLSGLALAVIALRLLSDREPLSARLSASHFHDLGNLMLAFVLLWAYMAFSQYLIIWSGNLPEEIPWYLHRAAGGWQVVAITLVVFHFALPFVLLLSRKTKRQPDVLARVAAGLLVARWLDMVWLVSPSWRDGLTIHVLDVLAPVAVGALWLWLFSRELSKLPLLPLHDPRFAEVGAGAGHNGEGREALEHG